MKKLLILLGVLFLAVLLGLGIAKVPGILILQLGQKTIAAPIWLIIFGLIILMLMAYFLFKILSFLIMMPMNWKNSFLNFKAKKREKIFREALNFYILKNYGKAWPRFKDLGQAGYLVPQTYYLAADAAKEAGESGVALDLLLKASRLGFSDQAGVAKKVREGLI